MALASHSTFAASHELCAVGFPQVIAVNKEIEDTDIAPVEVHFKLPASKPTQETGADIPAPLILWSRSYLYQILPHISFNGLVVNICH